MIAPSPTTGTVSGTEPGTVSGTVSGTAPGTEPGTVSGTVPEPVPEPSAAATIPCAFDDEECNASAAERHAVPTEPTQLCRRRGGGQVWRGCPGTTMVPGNAVSIRSRNGRPNAVRLLQPDPSHRDPLNR